MCAKQQKPHSCSIGEVFRIPPPPISSTTNQHHHPPPPPDAFMEKFHLKKLPPPPLVVTGLYKVITLPSLPSPSGALGTVSALGSSVPIVSTVSEEQASVGTHHPVIANQYIDCNNENISNTVSSTLIPERLDTNTVTDEAALLAMINDPVLIKTEVETSSSVTAVKDAMDPNGGMFNCQEVNVISCLSAALSGMDRNTNEEEVEDLRGRETNVIKTIDALSDHLHSAVPNRETIVHSQYSAAGSQETNVIKTRAIVSPRDLESKEHSVNEETSTMNNNETNAIKGLLSSFELPPVYLDKFKSPTKRQNLASTSTQSCREVTVITETPAEVGGTKSFEKTRNESRTSNQTNVIKENRSISSNYARRSSAEDGGGNLEYGIPLTFDETEPFDGSPTLESIEEELAPYENRSSLLDLEEGRGLESINFNSLYQGLFNPLPVNHQTTTVIVNNSNLDKYLR